MNNPSPPPAEDPRLVKAVGIAGILLLLALGFLLGRGAAAKATESALTQEVHAVSQKLDSLRHDCPKS